MGIKRATLFFHLGNYGWTENYFLPATATMQDTYNKAWTLARRRIALCGLQVTLPYIRCSDESLQRDSQVYAPYFYLSEQFIRRAENNGGELSLSSGGTYQAPAYEGVADYAYAAILVRQQATDQVFRTFYMRGHPAGALGANGFIRDDNYKTAWRNFWTWVKEQGWGFVANDTNNDTNPRYLITEFQAVDIHTVVMAPGFTVPSGTPVTITGGRGRNIPRGRHVAESAIPGRVTIPKLSVDLQYLGTAWIRRVVKTWHPINSTQELRSVSRRTGRPFGLPRGRRPKRR